MSADYSNTVEPKYNTFAILAIIFVWVGGLLGLIFGYIALSQIKRTGEQGRGMALAAVIIGWIGVAVAVFWIILIAVGVGIAASA